MLATRIIPTLLCRGRTLVKGQKFDSWRSVGNVAQAVRVHAMRGVDELCLLDIGATRENRGPDLKLIEELAGAMTTPLAVGGGIRTVEDVKQLLRHGADKVVINTGGPELIREVSDIVGNQAVVASIDVRLGVTWIRSGTACTEVYPQNMAQIMERAGAGEILLTCMEREGTLTGYDVELIRKVSEAVSIPVIAHGGCGQYSHMLDAIRAGASAVATGAMLQFTDATPAAAAAYLREFGVEVRVREAA